MTTATRTQRLVAAGGTFALTWGVVQHGGEGAIIGAVLASVVASNADRIIGWFEGGQSPQPVVDEDYPTEEEIAEYRRLHAPGNSNGDTEHEPDPTSRQDENPFGPNRDKLFTFSDILRTGFRPTIDCLFLARVMGKDIFSTARNMVHVALAGHTRAGKSNILRLLLLQLCACGVKPLLLDPHYTRYDVETGEDWTPFTRHLARDPMECKDYGMIESCLKRAYEIVKERLELRAQSRRVGKPIFIVIDELPAIVDEIEDAPKYLKRILREGAKVGVYLIVASQDFLVSTIGGTSATRDCYLTVFYVGGDKTTANVLLDMKASDIPESKLGKGIIMFRNSEVKEASEGWVPLVDNAAVEFLLGPSTYKKDEEDAGQQGQDDPMFLLTASSQEEKRTEDLPAKEKASIAPNIEQKLKSADIHIDTLVQAWNAGINKVDKIEAFFKMSHREAYKAYLRVKEQRGEPVEEQE